MSRLGFANRDQGECHAESSDDLKSTRARGRPAPPKRVFCSDIELRKPMEPCSARRLGTNACDRKRSVPLGIRDTGASHWDISASSLDIVSRRYQL